MKRNYSKAYNSLANVNLLTFCVMMYNIATGLDT